MKHFLNTCIFLTSLFNLVVFDLMIKSLLKYIAQLMGRNQLDTLSHGPLLFEVYLKFFYGFLSIGTMGLMLLAFHIVVALNVAKISNTLLIIWLSLMVLLLVLILPIIVCLSLWMQLNTNF
jgi:hypothetical protein